MPISYSSFNYVKIHKFDNGGVNNDIALGQATKLRIKYTTLSNYVTIGNIIDRIEYPTYWLYKVQSLGSNTADNYIKDYNVSASNVTPTLLPPNLQVLPSFLNVNGNVEGFFNQTSNTYEVPLTSNVKLSITASIVTSGSSTSNSTFFISQFNPAITSTLSDLILTGSIINDGDNVTTTLSASFFPLAGNVSSTGAGSTFPLIVKVFVAVFVLEVTVTVLLKFPARFVSYVTLITCDSPGLIGTFLG